MMPFTIFVNHLSCLSKNTFACISITAAAFILFCSPCFAQVIAGGNDHSMAICSDSTVWAWGDNNYGQLGRGGFTGSVLPVQANSAPAVKGLAAGAGHSLALKYDGTVLAWGWNL